MPRKPQYKREEIVQRSLEIVMEKGINHMTAREVAKGLGTTVAPIFVQFSSMDELKEEVRKAGVNLLLEYIKKGAESEHPFKGIGMQYLRFAAEQPNLYEMIYYSTGFFTKRDNGEVIFLNNDELEEIMIEASSKSFGLTKEQAKYVSLHMLIYSHGTASLIVRGIEPYDESVVMSRVSDLCFAMVNTCKTVDGFVNKSIARDTLFSKLVK